MSLGKQNFIDPKTYKQLVWADLADDEEEEARLEREIARQLIVGAGRSRSWTAAAAGAAGASVSRGLFVCEGVWCGGEGGGSGGVATGQEGTGDACRE
jgi:hypothetical protein